MDMNKLLEVTTLMGAKRNKVFVSTSSADKDFVVKLLNELEKEDVKFWCMYNSNGENVCPPGEVYTRKVTSALESCCVAVAIISPNSIQSEGLRNELPKISSFIKAGEKIVVIPVYIDGASVSTLDYDFLDSIRLEAFRNSTVYEQLDYNYTTEDIAAVARNVKHQYELSILANIELAWKNEIASREFSSLLATCSKNPCTSKTISDDIKESNELSSERLSEAHILSNELKEYDCNTYSCMIIASNLLGAEEMINGRKSYDPSKRGVKYFYYYPKKEEEEVHMTKNTIEGFIRKDYTSRMKVVSMIRREFSMRNRVRIHLETFNGLKVEDFEQRYHITNKDDIDRFREFFNSDDVQLYFDYGPNDPGNLENCVFRLPGEISAWLEGNVLDYNYGHTADTSYKFIRFMENLVKLLQSCEDVNEISYAKTEKKVRELLMLKKLEDWQQRRITLSPAESRKLTNYLLSYCDDEKADQPKKYPRLASWMSFDANSEGGEGPTSREVDAALRNFIGIEIADNNQLKLCYSFILFITDDGLTNGAWYSTGYAETGYSTNKQRHDIVFTYNIDRQTDECERLVRAFACLVKVNPSAKASLAKNQSKLLEKLK